MVLFLGRRREGSNKLGKVILKSVYGLGYLHTVFICNKFGLSFSISLEIAGALKLKGMEEFIRKSFLCGKEASRHDSKRVRRLVEVGVYRGIRRKQGLPVRGQRTHTNRKNSRRRAEVISTR